MKYDTIKHGKGFITILNPIKDKRIKRVETILGIILILVLFSLWGLAGNAR